MKSAMKSATINGVTLSSGQTMTLWIALNSFGMELDECIRSHPKESENQKIYKHYVDEIIEVSLK